jgi:hypothetical protein
MFAAALSISLSAQAPGWKVHTDPSQNASDPDNTPNLKFMTMGNGFHVVSGPAGTYWHPSNTATGNYTLKATFNLLQPSNHTNYYGLVFGGQEPGRSYPELRLFRRRAERDVPGAAAQWRECHHRRGTDRERGCQAAGRQRSGGNVLEVRVAGDTVSYVVNGTVVHSGPKGSLVTDGLAGFRINHVLSVQVEGFAVGK